jgi:Cys-tRNA(Pro) deacylase
MSTERVVEALDAAGVPYAITRHPQARSLAEAAELQGVEPHRVVKTLVVRRADDDFLFVLVPGDRSISWPKLRTLLGVSRLSMPDKDVAKAATGYERGTITPFGSTRAWPVVADERVTGTISLGGGAHGVGVRLEAADAVRALGARVADVTEPAA